MKKIIILASFVLLSAMLAAQNPRPAGPQTEPILIMNATAHLGNGKVIENSAIGFENGKLILVADATTIRIEKGRYSKTINAAGKHVYPGLIACNTTLGLTEIDMVRSTRDYNEVGEMNPNVRSLISYNTDSKIIPTVRSNGVLLAEVAPRGGLISGTSSVVALDGWNWEDAVFKSDVGIHVNWPSMSVARSGNAEQEENQRQRIQHDLAVIDQYFAEAKAYCEDKKPAEFNVRFESMRGVFNRSKKVFVHAGGSREIEAALLFSKRYGFEMVLVGGRDAWLQTALLKEQNVPVVLGTTHSLPGREDDDTDLPYRLPGMLAKAGIVCAIAHDGSWQVRNLPFYAGTAAAFGVTPEEALMMVTSNPARILGIGEQTGSLEVGKDATLLISTGDLLDMRTSNVEQAFIQGKSIDLDDIQKQLFNKYMEKYGLK